MKLAILLLIAVVSLRSQEISHTTAPNLIHKAEPRYTKEALDAKLQGTVALDSVIGIDGIPSEIKVVCKWTSACRGWTKRPLKRLRSGASARD